MFRATSYDFARRVRDLVIFCGYCRCAYYKSLVASGQQYCSSFSDSVMVLDKFGVSHHARALIDPGSETSLASESLAQRLRLPRKPTSVIIFGVGRRKNATSKGRVLLTINSRVGHASFFISALVLLRLTVYGGRIDAARKLWPHLQELELADPEFLAQDPIDLLLGADVHVTILREGLRKANPRSPIAQRTSLGWIISGLAGETEDKNQRSAPINAQLARISRLL